MTAKKGLKIKAKQMKERRILGKLGKTVIGHEQQSIARLLGIGPGHAITTQNKRIPGTSVGRREMLQK